MATVVPPALFGAVGGAGELGHAGGAGVGAGGGELVPGGGGAGVADGAGAGLAGGADAVRGAGHHGARRGRHPEQLGGLQDGDRGRLEQGRVGAEPSDDQPDPVHLAPVQAGQVALDRRRAHVADDADRGRAVQQGPDARGGPGGRGGEDLLLADFGLGPGGQAGAGRRMNRKSAYGSLAARMAGGSGTPWPASRSRTGR